MIDKIAVIVFVPAQPALLQQFFGLYSSVMMQPRLRSAVDFIIGCEPGIAHYFYNLDNCILSHTYVLAEEPDYQFRLMDNRLYPYINSWSHFAHGPTITKLLEYPYALRIDVDTFISPNVLSATIAANEVLAGVGGYCDSDIVKQQIVRVAGELGLRHRGLHNVGSTWLTSSENMIEIGRESLKCAQHLLQNEFAEMGEWPHWYALVTTMYAGEIALNASRFRISITDKIDAFSTKSRAVQDVYTIHCWHTAEYFSKHDYFDGKYSQLPTPLNIEGCADFALHYTRLAELVTPQLREPGLQNALKFCGRIMQKELRRVPTTLSILASRRIDRFKR